MRVRFALPLLLTLVVGGCETAPYDPGPEPDARAILLPQVDHLFPGAPVMGLVPQPAVPTPVGAVEIAPVRRAPPLAPAGWMACLRFEMKGERRTYAAFFKDKLLVLHRPALPADGCESESYATLRAKKPGA